MLKIAGMNKIFGKGSVNEKKALDNINLTMDEGEFVTIIGDNGAGKSTLLNCISGVYGIDEGSISIDSKDITFSPEYKRSKCIGRVFQDPLKGTAYDMTIEENLSIANARGKHRGLGPGIKKADIRFFKEQLTLLGLGLENSMKQKAGLLSGGQRQALTILMATISKPKLLLLDEHTAALDPSAAAKVLGLTKKIVEENNLCTIMVTHNMVAALEYGTRTIMMHDGRIILDIKGNERKSMTVEYLVKLFGTKSGAKLNDYRILLS